MAGYEVELTDDSNGMLLVTSLAIAEVTSFGTTREQALEYAMPAIQEAIAKRINDDRDIPAMVNEGQNVVHLPLLTMAKIELFRAVRTAGMRRNDLSRITEIPVLKIDQMLDLNNQTSITMIEQALTVLGRRFDLSVAEVKQKQALPV